MRDTPLVLLRDARLGRSLALALLRDGIGDQWCRTVALSHKCDVMCPAGAGITGVEGITMQIACSSRSLRREIPHHLSLVHFPAWCGSRGISLIEIDEKHLHTREPAYLAELRRACDAAGVSVSCLALQNDFTVPDPEQRFDQIERVRRLLYDVAVPLGAPVARVFLGMADQTPAGDARALEGFRSLVPDLEATGVTLALENHLRLNTPPDKTAALIAGVPTPLFCACVDLGSQPEAQRSMAIFYLAPLAAYVHARAYAFTTFGEEHTINYKEALAGLTEHGYDGVLSIVFDGVGDQYQGVLATKALIEKHWYHPEAGYGPMAA